MNRGSRIAGLCALGLLVAMVPGNAGAGKALQGEIKIDGSSTVYLITEAVAAQFKKKHPAVNISVGISGTGGGFKKFANGETDLSDASRVIHESEAKKCAANGVAFTPIQVAWDGLAVVVNKENTWATRMTMEQLKKIWHPDTNQFKNAKTWKDVDPSWPDKKLDLYGAGPDSGTFDYFTEAVNGKERIIRTDYNGSEDDNTIVQGVAGNKYAMGFFGVAYYEGNKGKLSVVSLSAKGGDFIAPTPDAVLSHKYPISRPLFLYLNHKSLQRDEVQQFLRFYVRRTDLVSKVGYVPLSTLQHAKEKQKLEKAIKAATR
jgi:phosphate transport system substrate-binding protein